MDESQIKSSDHETQGIKEENPRMLADHQAYLGAPRRVANADQIRVGDIVEFVYDAEPRTVYVLNPNYGDHLHGLSLKRMTHQMLMIEIIDKVRPGDSPHAFYTRVVSKPKIVKTGAYRTYDVRKMSTITIRSYAP